MVHCWFHVLSFENWPLVWWIEYIWEKIAQSLKQRSSTLIFIKQNGIDFICVWNHFRHFSAVRKLNGLRPVEALVSVDIRLQKIAFICVSALISAHFLQHHHLLQQFSSIAPVVSNKILYIRIKRHNGERSRHFYGTMGPLQIVILSNVYGLFYYLTECHERFSSAPLGTCDTRIERLLLNSAPGGVKASKWERNMLRFEIDLICMCHVPKKKSCKMQSAAICYNRMWLLSILLCDFRSLVIRNTILKFYSLAFKHTGNGTVDVEFWSRTFRLQALNISYARTQM